MKKKQERKEERLSTKGFLSFLKKNAKIIMNSILGICAVLTIVWGIVQFLVFFLVIAILLMVNWQWMKRHVKINKEA